MVELWYVTKTTQGVSQEELDAIREAVSASPTMGFSPIDEAVAGKFTTIDRDLLRDPWDRFIVATALAFGLPLVTADRRIQKLELVETHLVGGGGYKCAFRRSRTRVPVETGHLIRSKADRRRGLLRFIHVEGPSAQPSPAASAPLASQRSCQVLPGWPSKKSSILHKPLRATARALDPSTPRSPGLTTSSTSWRSRQVAGQLASIGRGGKCAGTGA